MNKGINVKVNLNKKNGQLNISLPKKQLSKKLFDKIVLNKDKKFKIKIEDYF